MWVSECKKCSLSVAGSAIRSYNQLLKFENSSTHSDGYLADINADSQNTIKNSMIGQALLEFKAWSLLNRFPDEKFSIKETEDVETCTFQALRLGHFCLGKDSASSKIS